MEGGVGGDGGAIFSERGGCGGGEEGAGWRKKKKGFWRTEVPAAAAKAGGEAPEAVSAAHPHLSIAVLSSSGHDDPFATHSLSADISSVRSDYHDGISFQASPLRCSSWVLGDISGCSTLRMLRGECRMACKNTFVAGTDDVLYNIRLARH